MVMQKYCATLGKPQVHTRQNQEIPYRVALGQNAPKAIGISQNSNLKKSPKLLTSWKMSKNTKAGRSVKDGLIGNNIG
jgi:hypothetical protein